MLEAAPLVEPWEIESEQARSRGLPVTIVRNQHGWFLRGTPRTRNRGKVLAKSLRTRYHKDVPTPRQLRALQLYANGLTYKQVGVAMGITEDTVKDHLRRARLTLRAITTAHAVAIAFRRRLLV